MRRRVIVTDHALVRYLERVGGFEIDLLRRSIADRLRPFTGLGATGVVIDGHVYVVDVREGDHVVTTILPKDRQHQPLFTARAARPKDGR